MMASLLQPTEPNRAEGFEGTYRTSPLWRVMGVVAIVCAAGLLVGAPFAVVQSGCGLPTAVLVLSFVVATAIVLLLWGLQRLTERIQLLDEALVHSVLGRTRSLALSEICRVRDKRRRISTVHGGAMGGWAPWRIVRIWDVHGRRIALTNYVGRLNALLTQLRSRTKESADVDWKWSHFWIRRD